MIPYGFGFPVLLVLAAALAASWVLLGLLHR